MSVSNAREPISRSRLASPAEPQRPAAPANGQHHRVPRTVAALCEQFSAVCASAVDPLEIASALEFEGLGDQTAKRRYGYPDVFALAQDMYFRVKREPAEPDVPPDPWEANGKLRPLLHGLLYALPGVCFPAAVGLLIGPGVEIALIVALLAAWSMGQGLAYLGYIRLGRTTDMDQTRRVLRVALAAGLLVVAAALAVTGRVAHAPPSALLFGLGEGIYMLGAGAPDGARRRGVAAGRARSWRAVQRRVPGPGQACLPAARDLGNDGHHPAAGLGARLDLHAADRPEDRRAVRPAGVAGHTARRRFRAGRGRPADLPRCRGPAWPRRHQLRGAACRAAALAQHGRGRGEPALVPAAHPAAAAHDQGDARVRDPRAADPAWRRCSSTWPRPRC